jgi:hypothetical protein
VSIVREYALPTWGEITVYVESPRRQLLPSEVLVAAKLREKRIVGQRCDGTVFLRTGERVRSRILTARRRTTSMTTIADNASVNDVLASQYGLCLESTHVIVKCCKSIANVVSEIADSLEPLVGHQQQRFG